MLQFLSPDPSGETYWVRAQFDDDRELHSAIQKENKI
jgi:hypothetical protein